MNTARGPMLSKVARMFSGASIVALGLTYGVTPTGATPPPAATTSSPSASANTWTPTGNLTTAQVNPTATLLDDGEVLVAGGATNAAELYDPSTGTFTPTGSMNVSRLGQTATLLQNGDVLVIGGCGQTCASAELYDPTTGTWSLTGPMLTGRAGQLATLLQDGDVLVTGGNNCGVGCTLSEAELYDPSTGEFSATGPMVDGRQQFAMTLLPSGDVLAAGGCQDDDFDFSCGYFEMTSAELYDPSTGQWATTGSMHIPRFGPTLTSLPGTDEALAVGGNGSGQRSAELYSQVTGTWKRVPDMAFPRARLAATALSDGTVLIAGGCGGARCTSAEVFNPATTLWSQTGSMSTPRSSGSLTVLADGQVLAISGCNCTSVERYTPGATPFVRQSATSVSFGDHRVGTSSQSMKITLTNTGTTVLDVSGVTISGGAGPDFSATSACTSGVLPLRNCTISFEFAPTATESRTAVAQIEDNAPTSPQTVSLSGWGTGPDAWASSGDLAEAVASPAATVLPGGLVLVSGGYDSQFDTVAKAYLFNPRTGSWVRTHNMVERRAQQTSTLLPDGEVLIAGGCNYGTCNNGYAYTTAELYNPTTGTFSKTASMRTPRGIETATLLPDGDVLVTGGVPRCCPGPALKTAEIYDPQTATWTFTGPMSVGRELHTATLLQDGDVLVAGGCSTNLCGGYLASAEIFDPGTDKFTLTGSMSTARAGQTATLLPDGDVLVAGGTTCTFSCPSLASAELYDPTTGTWSFTGSMLVGRQDATATLLGDGTVLVAGGCSQACGGGASGALADAEIYDPATGRWNSAGALHDARFDAAAVALEDGSVLVIGGYNGNVDPLTSIERYTPPLVFDQPRTGPAASTFTLSGINLYAHETVDVYWDTTSSQPIATAVTDDDGIWHATATVPSTASVGQHLIIMQSLKSGVQAQVAFTVTSGPP